MEEQKTLTLPVSGKTVVIKGYVSGLIDEEVKKVSMGANKARFEVETQDLKPGTDGKPDTDELPESGKMVMETDPTASLKADNKLLELMVISVDGQTEGALGALKALPVADTNFVMAEVKKLKAAGEVSNEEKKG